MRHSALPRLGNSPSVDRQRDDRGRQRDGAATGDVCCRVLPLAVAPLRNLTGDADQENLVEAFTDDLAADLRTHGRGFSLQRVANEPGNFGKPSEPAEPRRQISCHGQRPAWQSRDAARSMSGSAMRRPLSIFGPVGTNSAPNEAAPVQAQDHPADFSRAAYFAPRTRSRTGCLSELGAGHELNECLSSAATALEGELRPDLTAEAQRWFLAALAGDPRNVEALVGLARTCQELVSNPWWGDPLAASVASDLGREVVAIALNLAPGARRCALCPGDAALCRRKVGRGRACLRAGAGDGSGFGNRPRFCRLQRCLSRQRRDYAAGDRACDAPRSSRSAAQHLVLLWRLCRIAGRAHRGLDCPAPEIIGAQPQLRKCATFPDRGLIAERAGATKRPKAAALFRQQYPECPAGAFEQLWLSRSLSQPIAPRFFRYSKQSASLGGDEPDRRALPRSGRRR